MVGRHMSDQPTGPSGAAIIAALKASGIRTAVAVPDIWTSTGLLWPLSRDEYFRLVRICKEDEGVAICSALAYCDQRAALLMQSTGFLDSVNALRAIPIDYDQPVCMVVGLLGNETDHDPNNSNTYSVRVVTGILDVMGIDYALIDTTADVAMIQPGIDHAYAASRPFVALIGKTVTP